MITLSDFKVADSVGKLKSYYDHNYYVNEEGFIIYNEDDNYYDYYQVNKNCSIDYLGCTFGSSIFDTDELVKLDSSDT